MTPTNHPKPTRPKRWRRRIRRSLAAGLAGVGLFGLASCVRIDRANPAYPATSAQVQAAIDAMEAAPVGVGRPVVVLTGWRSPSLAGSALAGRIRSVTGADPDRVISISYLWGDDIPSIADDVARKVAEAFGRTIDPATGAHWTAEVDVVAVSMGGLVARAAWAEATTVGREADVRLNIRTLYTLGSPHRGAKLAEWIRLDDASVQMRPGSAFLAKLDETLAHDGGPAIVPYATLRDTWVGASHSAPTGQDPIWVPGRLVLSHHLISLDRRILADLGRRLRGEEPLAAPSPPPHD